MQLLFRLYNFPDEEKVTYAAFHLTDIASAWFMKISAAKSIDDWELFTWILRREFSHLRTPEFAEWPRQIDSVDDYIQRFSARENQSTNVSKFERLHIFLSGLSPVLRHLLDSSSPASLETAKQLALELEQQQGLRPWSVRRETRASPRFRHRSCRHYSISGRCQRWRVGDNQEDRETRHVILALPVTQPNGTDFDITENYR